MEADETVALLDIRERDIADYRRWLTVQTEWTRWDAPWEPREDDFVERFIARLTRRIERASSPANKRYEIYCGDRHVGWVSSYFTDEARTKLAVGIVIPEDELWGKGIGRRALAMFFDRLFELGHPAIYCQTWSGNVRMVGLAQSLGFEFDEDRGGVTVNGAEYRKLTYVLHKIENRK